MNLQHETDRRPRAPAAMRAMAVLLRWAAFITVAAQLLFAHGCHGDEDHELFAAISRLMQP